MKYIEPIKSVTLLVMVILSLVLTFVIWTYTPDYEFVENPGGEQVTIGDKKSMNDVIKPYKALFRAEDKWTGTVSKEPLDNLMDAFKSWNNLELVREPYKLSKGQLNEMIRANNRITMFFSGEVPFSVLNVIFPSTNSDLPETTFSHIIIDWDNYNDKELQLYFVSANNTMLYHYHVNIHHPDQFIDKIIKPSKKYSEFEEVEREGVPSLYVVNEKIELVKYTYVFEKDSLDNFKKVLFTDPNVVGRDEDGTNIEKYQDGMSLMTIDKKIESLEFVSPTAESNNRVLPSKLLKDSFEFINGHGGIKDYRFVSMNPAKNQIDYRLFLEGFPVHSDPTIALTRMTTIWGNNQIYKYIRPYYSLEVLYETENKELPSGKEMIEKVYEMNNIDLSEIDEITVGYYLTRDEEQRLFILEPSWFLLHNGYWERIAPKMLGGVENGLE